MERGGGEKRGVEKRRGVKGKRGEERGRVERGRKEGREERSLRKRLKSAVRSKVTHYPACQTIGPLFSQHARRLGWPCARVLGSGAVCGGSNENRHNTKAGEESSIDLIYSDKRTSYDIDSYDIDHSGLTPWVTVA